MRSMARQKKASAVRRVLLDRHQLDGETAQIAAEKGDAADE